jgi:two-component system, OmpR family, sensor kinase
MNLPLKTRLTWWYVALFAVIIATWGFVVVGVLHANLYAEMDRALSTGAATAATEMAQPKPAKFTKIGAAALSNLPAEQSALQVVSGSGAVVSNAGGDFSATSLADQKIIERAIGAEGARITTLKVGTERYRLLVQPLPGDQQLVVIATSTHAADEAVSRLRGVMWWTAPFALLAAALGGWFLARRALEPVVQLTKSAAGIGIDRLDERVPVPTGNDELSALAVTLNKMLDRLQAGVDDKRRLIADASHELQTPLAVMRTELDVSLATSNLTPESIAVLESAREETDRMTRIVRNLLTLARFDEGTLTLLRKPINVLALLTDSAATLSGLAAEREVEVTVSGDDIVVLADAEYLRLVVVNLIENAIKHSEVGTSVTVTIDTAGAEARISVTDTGPGIPEEDQPHVFDRFYRVDRARSKQRGGSGLGLAISREIVEAHDGRVELKSKEGEGSTFRIILPIVPAKR